MPYLVVENGNRRGLKVEIPPNGKVVFGRDARNEIAVTDHLCSRRHFEVVSRNGQYVLEDLGSSNGTYVNGLPIFESTPLNAGDRIDVGGNVILWIGRAPQGQATTVPNPAPPSPTVQASTTAPADAPPPAVHSGPDRPANAAAPSIAFAPLTSISAPRSSSSRTTPMRSFLAAM